MKKFLKVAGLVVAGTLFASTSFAQSTKYKCMLQMNNYKGLKAYVVISLIKPNGTYEKTLAVLGDDKQWFNTLKEWYKFQSKTKEKISGVTGASIGGGDRAVRMLDIDASKINAGYKLRFESAVEEQKYFASEVDIPLTTAGLAEKADGKGYIRTVKIIKAL